MSTVAVLTPFGLLKSDYNRDRLGRFAPGGGTVEGSTVSGGSSVPPDEAAIAASLGIPTTYHGSDSDKPAFAAVDNPLPRSKQVTFAEGKSLPLRGGESKTVDIASLRTTQDYVQPSAVKHYKDGTYMKSQPVVATVHGEQVILNGNHNVLAVKLNGAKTISVLHLGDLSSYVSLKKAVTLSSFGVVR